MIDVPGWSVSNGGPNGSCMALEVAVRADNGGGHPCGRRLHARQHCGLAPGDDNVTAVGRTHAARGRGVPVRVVPGEAEDSCIPQRPVSARTPERHRAGHPRRHVLRCSVRVRRPPDTDPEHTADRVPARVGEQAVHRDGHGILLLQARHLLNVSDRLCRYLADCPSRWQAITIEELLTHTSGIPDYLNDLDSAWPPRPATPGS